MGSTPEISDTHESAAQLIPWLINGTLDAEEAASVRAHVAVCAECRADFEAERRLYEAIRADGPLIFSGEPSFEKLMARIEADDFAAANAMPVSSEVPAPVRAAVPAAVPAAAPAASPVPPIESPVSQAPAAARRGTPLNRARQAKRAASDRRGARHRFWRSASVVRWLAAAAVIETIGLGLGVWAWQTRVPAAASAYASTSGSARWGVAPYRTLTTPAASYMAGPRVRVVFRPGLSLDQLQDLLRGVGAHIVDGPSDARVFTLAFTNPVASTEALDVRIATLRADPNVLFAEPAAGSSP